MSVCSLIGIAAADIVGHPFVLNWIIISNYRQERGGVKERSAISRASVAAVLAGVRIRPLVYLQPPTFVCQ